MTNVSRNDESSVFANNPAYDLDGVLPLQETSLQSVPARATVAVASASIGSAGIGSAGIGSAGVSAGIGSAGRGSDVHGGNAIVTIHDQDLKTGQRSQEQLQLLSSGSDIMVPKSHQGVTRTIYTTEGMQRRQKKHFTTTSANVFNSQTVRRFFYFKIIAIILIISKIQLNFHRAAKLMA